MREPLIGPLAWSQLVSSFGSAMVGLAIVYISYDQTNSIFHTVLVTVAYTIPAAILGPFAGRLANHHSRRRIMLFTWTLKMGVYASLAPLSAAGALTANHLLIVSFISGSLSAFNYPAWLAFERDIVPADRLDRANALFASMTSVAQLAGAVGGGVLLSTIGATTVFVLNALSYLPELVIVAKHHPRETTAPAEGSRHEFRQAVAHIRNTPSLRHAFLTLVAISVLVGPVVNLLPAIAADVSSSASALGIFTAVFAAGAAFVAWAVGRLKAGYTQGQLQATAVAVLAVLLIGFGVFQFLFNSVELAITVALLLVPVGLFGAIASTLTQAIVQARTPPEIAADVLAVYSMTYSTLAPAGALILSGIAEDVDVLYTISIAGAVLIAFTLLRLRWLRDAGEALPPSHLMVAHARSNIRHRHLFQWGVSLPGVIPHPAHPVVPGAPPPDDEGESDEG